MAARTFQADARVIDDLRKAKSLTMAQLAAKALCSKRTLDNLLLGKPAYLSTFSKIANVLGVPAESLMAGYVPPPKQTDQRFEVQIKLAIPYENFDESEQLASLITLLKGLIGGRDIDVVGVRDGSTIITLAMNADDIIKLVSVLREKEPVTHGRVTGAAGVATTGATAGFWGSLGAILGLGAISAAPAPAHIKSTVEVELQTIVEMRLPSDMNFPYANLRGSVEHYSFQT